jgi:hypothetical protein
LDYVKATWSQEIQSKTDLGRGKVFNDFWIELLQTGVAMSGGRRDRTSSARAFVGRVSVKPVPNRAVMELVLHANSQMMDGRYANVPWLQELPDPVSKVVWDNYLAVSPAWAREQGVKQGDVIEITSGDFTMRFARWPSATDEKVLAKWLKMRVSTPIRRRCSMPDNPYSAVAWWNLRRPKSAMNWCPRKSIT